MNKETLYFSHDSNAREDEKILDLRMEMGWEGYGIYWAIVEMLRESPGYKMQLKYKSIAFALQTESEKVERIVTGFGLFLIEEGLFYSESLLERMFIKEQKSKKARNAAYARWGNEKEIKVVDSQEVNANALQTESDPNASKEKKRKEKESKVKQSKVNEKKESYRFAPPNLTEIYDYMLEKKLDVNTAKIESQKFADFYDSKNWMVGKNKMTKWKSAVSGWINRMDNFKPNENGNKGTGTGPTINRQTAEVIASNRQGWEIE